MSEPKKPDVKKPEVSTVVPRTREEFEKALAERKALTTMLAPGVQPAGQAPAGAPPVTYVEAPRPAAPPAPAVNVSSIEAIRQQKLAEIEFKIERRQKVKTELAEQQANAAALIETMKANERRLAAESEALEAEVGAIQRELAAAEAQHLATQALKAQALRPSLERLPLDQWRAKFREAILPLQHRIAAGLGKMQALFKDKGATLETVAALRSQPGLDNETRSEYIAVSEAAKQALGDLHNSIHAHERALAHAEDFVADPRSPDGKSAINGLRRTLENVSGIITGRLVDIVNPRADANPHPGIEGQTPASAELEHRVGELLNLYARVQKKVNAVTRPLPTVEITIIPKPRHEVMAEIRGPKNDQQVRAAGVPKEV